ncbi:hypothetical protein HPB49_018459 [Dermacentor silvarum]|uniref:Uncharacterized protein n=1 Tax=Dermacentor silvarum TaxID=543639 RepID=A0ACB8CZ99_DERSI|nr:hypothetical protein HPB49_018459 [Dermacentor silvarum]
MGTLDASWQNVGTNLGSDHDVIRITIRGPTLKTWEKQQLDIVEKHTQKIATTHQTPRIDARLAHLWEARRSLTKRWKRQRHNKKLRKRIQEINDKAAEYAADLCKESWLDLCDGLQGTLSTRKTWQLLRHLIDPMTSKSETNRRNTSQTKSHSGRLLYSLWWLTVLVLTNGFAGQLKASMAIKTEPTRFRSADDVTQQPAIRPFIWKHTVYEAYVQCRLTGGRLYVAPELLFTRFCTVAHSKRLDPELERRIHAKVTTIMESGLTLKWHEDGMQEWHHCQAMQQAGSSQAGELSFKVLRYDDMAAVFSLWAIMAALSLVAFLLELCVHRTAARRHHRLPCIHARRNARLAVQDPAGRGAAVPASTGARRMRVSSMTRGRASVVGY